MPWITALSIPRTVASRSASNSIELTEKHIHLLERFDPEFRERHIQADYTGQLVAIDTFMMGTLKGVGKVY